jgi:hypothetical protein
MSKHIDRQELIRRAREGNALKPDEQKHAAECEECRTIWELFVSFAGSADARLTAAPSAWVERAAAIARSGKKSVLTRLTSKLVFDSWLEPAYVGLRGARDADARRLEWHSGPWRLDLRAEAVPAGWEMVAQVQRNGEAVVGATVAFQGEAVHTDAAGMAVWSGRRPPRKIELHTDEGIMQCGDLAWSRPKRS